jgi:type I restriction enzyme, S subunit
MSEWPMVRFEDLADSSKSAFSKPYGSAILKEDYLPCGVPVVRGVNLRNGIFFDDDFVFISEEKADRMPGANLTSGDLVFTHRGTIGQVSMIPWNRKHNRYVLSTSHVKARLDGNRALPEFYFYYFSSPRGQTELLKNISTVGVPGLAQPVATIKALSVPHPPLATQRAIAQILGGLDGKIAVNDQIAETSRKLAVCTGQRLFLGTSGKGVFLGDFVDIVKGISYRSSDLDNGTYGLVSLKCVGRHGEFRPDGIKPYGGEYKQSQLVDNGDIIVAQTDLTQRVEVIGRPVRVLDLGGFTKLIASLDLAIVRPRGSLSREVLLSLLSTEVFRDHALSYCNGTTVVHLGSKALPEFKFAMPELDAVRSATAEMTPLLALSDQARHENRALTELRNTLLPKLMSGAIRVRDAEKVIEDVT